MTMNSTGSQTRKAQTHVFQMGTCTPSNHGRINAMRALWGTAICPAQIFEDMVFPAHIQSPGRSGNDRWQLLKFEMPRYDNSKLTGEARLRHVASLVWCAVDALLDGCTYGCPGKWSSWFPPWDPLDPLDPWEAQPNRYFWSSGRTLGSRKWQFIIWVVPCRPYSTNSTTLARL